MERQKLYFYEELGWGLIFVINTIASAILYWTLDSLGGRELLLQLNLLFGVFYLPWQLIHLRDLRLSIKHQEINKDNYTDTSLSVLKRGFYKSIQMKNLTTEPENWGGALGMTWMIGYWAILIPSWIYLIVQTI